MNRPFSPLIAVMEASPLLAVAFILPAGLDDAVAPLAAAGLPLAWAAAVDVVAGLGPKGTAVALVTAMPFSAYALAAFSPSPTAPWLIATVMAVVAAIASLFASTTDRAPTRARTATALAVGAAPGLALAFFSSPPGGAALSAFIVAAALLLRDRRSR